MIRSIASLVLLACLTFPTISLTSATPFSRLVASTEYDNVDLASELADELAELASTDSAESEDSASAPCVDDANSVLYITFHGGKKSNTINIAQRYSLAGAPLGDVYSNTCSSQALRSMVLMDDGTLLIANADDANSRVLQFSNCQADGTRTYIQDYATNSLNHPYGVALGNGNLYVSSQNINTVNAYSLTDQSWLGTIDNMNPDQIRSVAVNPDASILYISDKDANTVVAWNMKTNTPDATQYVPANDPIGLYWEPTSKLLYVGSGKDETVFQWDPVAKTVGKVFSDPSLQHPAGMTVNGDALYVISQTAKSILQFSISSGAFVGAIATDLPDVPEQIIISNC